jgi:hypothetical protein
MSAEAPDVRPDLHQRMGRQNNAGIRRSRPKSKREGAARRPPLASRLMDGLRPPRLPYRNPFSLVQRAALGVLRVVLRAEVVWRRPLLPFRLVDFCVRPVDFCDVWRTPLIRSSGNSEARVLA